MGACTEEESMHSLEQWEMVARIERRLAVAHAVPAGQLGPPPARPGRFIAWVARLWSALTRVVVTRSTPRRATDRRSRRGCARPAAPPSSRPRCPAHRALRVSQAPLSKSVSSRTIGDGL
jgi:hypothetical protein